MQAPIFVDSLQRILGVVCQQSFAAYETDVTYILLAITLIVLGAGVLSLDAFPGFFV